MTKLPIILRPLFTALLFALLLAGCDQQAMLEKLTPADESALARDLIAKLAERDFAFVESRLGSSLQTSDVRQKLEEAASYMPKEKPTSVRTVGSSTMSMNSATTYNLTYEYEYPGKWLIVNAILERKDGKVTLEGIHLTPMRESLETANRFSFENKGPLHYVVFVSAICISLFIVCTLIVCARTKIARRKWLWLLFVALGVVQFHFNWTTGAWNLQPVSVSLLGAGFVKMGPVAPWVFTLSLPLGAVVFLFRRRSLQAPRDA